MTTKHDTQNLHLTATIGQNTADGPMDFEQWISFCLAMKRILDFTTWSLCDRSVEAYTEQWISNQGKWEDEQEMNCHRIMTAPLRDDLSASDVAFHIDTMLTQFALLAWEFEQDCIAVSYAIPGHKSGAGLIRAAVRS